VALLARGALLLCSEIRDDFDASDIHCATIINRMSIPSTLGQTTSRFLGRLRRLRRNVQRRWHEKRVSGLEIGQQLRIYDLVCPLRYDILVRAEFIRLIAANDNLMADENSEIVRSQAAHDYEVWFREVEILRFFPELYHDEQQIRARLAMRVQNLKKLWESISSRGFDAAHPIRLRGGESIMEVNGKSVSGPYFAGDGCHRIACLIVMGKEYLEPEEYEVALSTKFQPLDNTAILLDKLPVTRQDYLSFISRGYCGNQSFASENDILADLEKHNPGRLDELKSILRHDLSRLN
jgi:hypothetical protein